MLGTTPDIVDRTQVVSVHDKQFTRTHSGDALRHRTAELAHQISESLADKDPLVLAVLNGAFIFAADLMRYFDFDPEIQFIKLASYHGLQSTGTVRELIGLDSDKIAGRHILIIEDIVDSGKTLGHLRDSLTASGATGISIVALLVKPDVFDNQFPLDYVGFEIPNAFVVGYGLDYDGYGRSLDGIYELTDK